MSRYFNPTELEAVYAEGGRLLNAHSMAGHKHLTGLLRPGESLGRVVYRNFMQIADVSDPREFDDYDRVVSIGHLIHVSWMAIPSDAPGWNRRLVVAAEEIGSTA